MKTYFYYKAPQSTCTSSLMMSFSARTQYRKVSSTMRRTNKLVKNWVRPLSKKGTTEREEIWIDKRIVEMEFLIILFFDILLHHQILKRENLYPIFERETTWRQEENLYFPLREREHSLNKSVL